jgi:hypothetical protein
VRYGGDEVRLQARQAQMAAERAAGDDCQQRHRRDPGGGD